jgi:hypothetical protein
MLFTLCPKEWLLGFRFRGLIFWCLLMMIDMCRIHGLNCVPKELVRTWIRLVVDTFNFCLCQKCHCHCNFLKGLLYVGKNGCWSFRFHGLIFQCLLHHSVSVIAIRFELNCMKGMTIFTNWYTFLYNWVTVPQWHLLLQKMRCLSCNYSIHFVLHLSSNK